MKRPLKQQVVTVFKHGPRPRKTCRVLVAGDTPLDRLKLEICDGLGIATRENFTLNTVSGGEVKTVYDILTEKNNIIVASFPGEFNVDLYAKRPSKQKERTSHVTPLTPFHHPPLVDFTPIFNDVTPILTHSPLLKPTKSALKTTLSSSDTKQNVSFLICDTIGTKRRRNNKTNKPKGAYQRVPPPAYRLPPMSKSSTTRLPPIAGGGGWDNSSDGRSSGSDIMQRRVEYERQRKREYNARHSNRMNKLSDESAMEVSDILLSHERQRRTDHQTKVERRQLQMKHIQDKEQRLHNAYKPVDKVRSSEKRFPKKLPEKVRVGRPPATEYHKDVLDLFTTPHRSKLPNSLNKHFVLPSVNAETKPERPSMIPISKLEQKPKRKRANIQKVSSIPTKIPIPSIAKQKQEQKVEIIRESSVESTKRHDKNTHLLRQSNRIATPEFVEQPKPIIPALKKEAFPAQITPARRPSTPIAKAATPITKPIPTSSSRLSVASEIENIPKEVAVKPEIEVIHRVHTPQVIEDLGYDSPKPTLKHPNLSSLDVEEDIKLPAKLTQRDSGLADSIEPDSTESRRQSVTPEQIMQSPEQDSEEEIEEETIGEPHKLYPLTEETESESPPLEEVFKFKPMLEKFNPKSETALNNLFIMGHTLGDGNFAIVKNAINRESKRSVAIKIIDKEKLKGKEGMMVNEIKIMRGLSHEHCVKLYDIYESEPHIYLVTELLPDGDLFDCIVKNRCFPESGVRGMMVDMVSALEYMHSRSIVHRDIKPENILVTKGEHRFRLKLGDFGLSMVVKEPIYTICGTPTYIAPEILVECGYGLEIDMWAVGVINYILLCGFPPFRSKKKDQEELFSLIMAGEFRFVSPYWDKISGSAKDLITKLLQVVPDDRYSAKQVLNHTWILNVHEE